MREIGGVAAVGEEQRLAVVRADPGIVEIDLDHQLGAQLAVDVLLAQPDQEGAAALDRGDVASPPALGAEEEILVAIEAEQHHRLERARRIRA